MTVAAWRTGRAAFIAAASTLAATLAAFTATAQPVANAPRVRVGDQWVYQRTLGNGERRPEELVRVTTFDTGRRVMIESTNAPDLRSPRPFEAGLSRRQVRRDPATLEAIDVDVIAGSLPLLAFPLRDGALWQYSRRSRVPGGEQLEEGEGEVVGVEPVDVPAGRFDAFRIRHRYTAVLTANPAFRRVTTIELWYVPKVKRWVRFDFASSAGPRDAERYLLELTQFEVEPE